MEPLFVSDKLQHFSFPIRPLIRFPIPTKSSFIRSLSTHPQKHRRFPFLRYTSAVATDRFHGDYGGWDELELLHEQLRISSNLDPLDSLLNSVGIHDRKQVFLILIGFLSALAFARLRFSAVVVFPISILVFVIGYATGLVRNGGFVSDLMDLFDDFDDKFVDLKDELESCGKDEIFEVDKYENLVKSIESLRLTMINAKKNVKNSVGGELGNTYFLTDLEVGKVWNKKSARKRKEFGDIGYEIVQSLGSLIVDNLVALKPSKAKGTVEKETTEKQNHSVNNNANSANVVKEENSNKVEKAEKEVGIGDSIEDELQSSKGVGSKVDDDVIARNNEACFTREKPFGSKYSMYSNDMLFYDEELGDINRTSRFVKIRGSSKRMVVQHRREANHGASYREAKGATDFFTEESEASTFVEETREMHSRSFLPSYQREKSQFKDEGIRESINKEDVDSMPSSSTISADEEFSQNVKEASELLKRAREYMARLANEEVADAMLYKSENLLSKALEVRPMSLMAVGQLGNAYLLHGELKLRISRELRSLLSRSDDFLKGKHDSLPFKHLDLRNLTRDNVRSVLADVCEECELLLINAGRTYRLALSIDSNDVRSLYNWGLALSFRAELISDIGPEAAFDADKVYLAAIDKFDAMMSKSNIYEPDALYRWGVVLQRRSQLRPDNSREKRRLLQQAKTLFEDVLSLESDNERVRDALSSCISDLNIKRQW